MAASVTLITTQPIFVVVVAATLLDERLTARMVGGLVVALAGALFGAVYVLSGRSLRQRLPLFANTFVVYSASSVALGLLAIGTSAELLGYPSTEWVLFLAMGLVPGMFGHTVINWALIYVESSVVSVSLLGEPVGSTILALAFLGEIPEGVTILGDLVVLVGMYVRSRARAT